jgi:hypothetical protein
MRCTDDVDTPDAFVMPRVLQCVALAGFFSRPSCPLGIRVTERVTRPDVSTKARERNGGCFA